jgi:hypothetical protein
MPCAPWRPCTAQLKLACCCSSRAQWWGWWLAALLCDAHSRQRPRECNIKNSCDHAQLKIVAAIQDCPGSLPPMLCVPTCHQQTTRWPLLVGCRSHTMTAGAAVPNTLADCCEHARGQPCESRSGAGKAIQHHYICVRTSHVGQ